MGGLSIAHNRNYNPYIFRWEDPAMMEREKFDHLEEKLRAIEGGGTTLLPTW